MELKYACIVFLTYENIWVDNKIAFPPRVQEAEPYEFEENSKMVCKMLAWVLRCLPKFVLFIFNLSCWKTKKNFHIFHWYCTYGWGLDDSQLLTISYDIHVGTKFEIVYLVYPRSRFKMDCSKVCGNDWVGIQKTGEGLQKPAIARKGLIFFQFSFVFFLCHKFIVFPMAL